MPQDTQAVVAQREGQRGRDLAVLLDVSRAESSVKACQLADEFLERLEGSASPGVLVDLNAGDLLLTKSIVSKIKQQVQRVGGVLGTVYAMVPQTQQAALDEGLYVKERLVTEWVPMRQELPLKAKQVAGSGEASMVARPALSPVRGVDLPDFSADAKRRSGEVVEALLADDASGGKQDGSVESVVEEAPAEAVLEDSPSLDEAEQAPVLDESQTWSETAFETLYLRQTLRSGQVVRFNGNVVIVGDVHAGSEITAGGDIVVWGELRGIAHAGAQGNYKAEIRAMRIEALQLRIADYIARRPDRIFYHKEDADALLSPEAARVADGEIKIFKTMMRVPG